MRKERQQNLIFEMSFLEDVLGRKTSSRQFGKNVQKLSNYELNILSMMLEVKKLMQEIIYLYFI